MAFPNGRFVWFEYVSKDVAKAQGFFGELFHWKSQVMAAPGTPGGGYTMIALNDQTIGGFVPTPQGAPPHGHWLAHLGVENAAATCEKIKKLGGKVRKDPVAMAGYGTWAVVADPTDATFVLWQPNKMEATEYKDMPGAFCWNELLTDNPDKAIAFYKEIAGYTVKPMGSEMGDYNVLEADGKGRAGVMKKMMGDTPNMWLPYVQVTNVDHTADKAKKLGSTIVAGPQDIPGIGRFAVFIDPQGGALGLLQPHRG